MMAAVFAALLAALVFEFAAEFLLDGDFAGDDDETGGNHGLAGDASHGIVLEDGVENGVRNLVGYFIWVALGDRFRGE